MSVSSEHSNTAQPSQDRTHEKPEAGASWKTTEQHVLPFNRLGIVIPGLMACVFLAALDQVSTPLI